MSDAVALTPAASPPRHALDPLLRPSSVAIIGASPDPTKRGHRAVRALQASGYHGRIVPVHPAGGTLHELRVARGPADLDAPVDLVLVCTPAATVPGVLEEWAAAGARSAVVLAVGFRESGEAGERIEQEIAAIARRTGLRVVGPNTSGILNVPLGLNLIGLDGVRAGPVALLGQSGNIALALVTEAARASVGFRFVIGLGNEVDVRFDEVLDFLAADDGTGAIAVHAEGFRDGRAFLAAAARAARRKPVVMIKGARTESGRRAARSHTGAVAGSYDALRAGLRQAGVIEIVRTDELLPTLATLVAQPVPRLAGGVAILSDGGGQSTLAIDDLYARGTPIAPLSSDTTEALRTLLGPAAAVGNPVDLAGAADRDPAVFPRALELIAADPGVGAVLVVGLFGGYAIRFDASLFPAELEAAGRLASVARSAGTALVVHSLYAELHPEPLRVLQREGVAVTASLEVACRCVHACVERRDGIARLARLPRWPAEVGAPGHGSAPRTPADSIRGGTPAVPAGGDGRRPLETALGEGRRVLLETEARALLTPFGLPLVPATPCRTPADAAAAARAFGGTVAIRIVSPAATHKTDAGGVALAVPAEAAADAAECVVAGVRAWAAGRGLEPDIRGTLVSPMLSRPLAELLVGVRRDAQFGPVLTVGAGGTGVEWLRDVATRVLPVVDADVEELLDALRMAPLLRGHRGAAPADRPALLRAIRAVADCASAHERISDIEVNPLFVYANGVVAVDVRIFLD